LLALLPALAPCAGRSRGSTEQTSKPNATPAAQPRPGARPVADPPPATSDEELVWDSSVGWEHRIHFQPGEISHRRDHATYLTLRDASLNDARMFKRFATGGVGLRDRSLIATPAELCNPVLRTVVNELSPDRLFVRIERGLTAVQVECLAQLKSPLLYLALCPYEGPYADCDGDAELAALAGNAEVAARVRALGVAFSERESWAYLTKFSRLEYLGLHGPALQRADWDVVTTLCALPRLAFLDVQDAGHSLFEEFEACAFPRRAYLGSRLPPGPSKGSACALRRVLVDELSRARRSELATACPSLTEIQTVYER